MLKKLITAGLISLAIFFFYKLFFSKKIPDGMVVISPKKNVHLIKLELLKHVPVGSKIEDVTNFIDKKLYRVEYHKSNTSHAKYKNEFQHKAMIKKENWWPSDIEPGGYIYVTLGYYGSFPKKVIGTWWYFDNTNKLIKLNVTSRTGPP